MTDLYDILKANRLKKESDPWLCILGEAWRASEEDYKEYTGLVPYTFIGNGQPLISWMIKGNTVQNGTPTPDSPVMPQGTGERTGNLFDITAATSGKYVRDTDGTLGNFEDTSASDYIDVSNITTLYPQYFTEQRPVRQWAAFYDSSKTFISGFSGYNQAITIPNDAAYVRLTVDNNYISNFAVSSSELENYEPYGIKIPISSTNTTTPIYLGEVQSTRQIQKVVLTGEETWINNSNNACCVMYLQDIGLFTTINPLVRCSHFPTATSQSELYNRIVDYGITFGGSSADRICIRNKDTEPVTDFKTYLQQQYANGTPVTVWYVLATPTTGIVNEPLMKIGDYADSISDVVSIPTVRGKNVFDVDMEVKPSEVYIKYKSR